MSQLMYTRENRPTQMEPQRPVTLSWKGRRSPTLMMSECCFLLFLPSSVKYQSTLNEICFSLMPSQPICAADICQWASLKHSISCRLCFLCSCFLSNCFEPILCFTVKSPNGDRSTSWGGEEETSRNSSLASGRFWWCRSYPTVTLCSYQFSSFKWNTFKMLHSAKCFLNYLINNFIISHDKKRL